jgi:hypothetical protein
MDFWKTQQELHKKLSDDSTKKTQQAEELDIYKKLNKEAYKKYGSQTIGDDWNLITQDINNKVYQNRKTGEITQAIAGSKNISDFINDGLQLLNMRDNSFNKSRIEKSSDLLDRLNLIQNKRDITLTGHSLGGQIVNRLIKDDKSKRGINFNAYIPHKSLNIDDDRVINVRNKNDFASKLTKHNKNTINLNNNSNSIKSHFLDQINFYK